MDKDNIKALQRSDADFHAIVVALEVKSRLRKTGKPHDDTALYKELKPLLKRDEGASKAADQAIGQLKHYELEGLLYRLVLDPATNSVGKRVVVPTGGLRSFWLNGRRYRLPLRKSLLLLFHDSETIGGHPSARDTLAKVAEQFWWPGLEHDVRRWCATCAICRMVKPSAALTAEQRTELHDRPFHILFIDTIGPIRPADGEYSYIAHAECPFSRFVWLEPLKENSDVE